MRKFIICLFASALICAVGCGKKEEAPAPVPPDSPEVTQPIKPEPIAEPEIPAPAKLEDPKPVVEEKVEEAPAPVVEEKKAE